MIFQKWCGQLDQRLKTNSSTTEYYYLFVIRFISYDLSMHLLCYFILHFSIQVLLMESFTYINDFHRFKHIFDGAWVKSK